MQLDLRLVSDTVTIVDLFSLLEAACQALSVKLSFMSGVCAPYAWG